MFELASHMRILNHNTGFISRWKPTVEQYKIWWEIYHFGDCFFLKPRQMGATTAVVFEMAVWLAMMDAMYGLIDVATFIDTADKAVKVKEKVASFLEQLGVEYTRHDKEIRLQNRSSWTFATAGGKRAAASMSLLRVHLTELPFYKNPTSAYTSIMPSVNRGGIAVVETTMEVSDPVGHNLWLNAIRYRKVFFSVEDHHEYRLPVDPDVLTEEKWEWLQNEGFTIPEAAMFWLVKLADDCAGDVQKCWREYPQKPEHAFKFAEGRFVNAYPEILIPLSSIIIDGSMRSIEVFCPPANCSSRLAMGVDTSAGVGEDSCSVSLIDAYTRNIVACWTDDRAHIDTTVAVTQYLQQMYTRDGHCPPAIIETNGIGHGTGQLAEQMGVAIIHEDMNTSKKHIGLLGVKRAIEKGQLFGPEELFKEASTLRRKGKVWVGPKDLMMATGFAYRYLGLCDGIAPPEPEEKPRPGAADGRFNLEERGH